MASELKPTSNSIVMAPGGALRAKYDFRWDVLEVIIGGKSAIDSMSGFHMRDASEAERFVESYGYHLDNPIEQAEVLGNFREALSFIRKYFLQPENPDGLKLDVPRRILELQDIRDLFLMASLNYPGQTPDSSGMLLRNWACSVLKVMHTIAHIDKDLRSPYFSDIQTQVFDRFYKVVQRNAEGQLYLGEKESDTNRIPLVAFETKPKKSRDSTILKLLHKPENVAEDIFDRVGIRFVTEDLVGALLVVKFLRDQMIIMPPNIKPSRSRNTLIDITHFQAELGDILGRTERGELDETGLISELRAVVRSPLVNPDNPHSSEFYRAIQFTCRQLIKLRNPLYNEIKELRTLVRSKNVDEEIQARIEKFDLKQIQKEVRFFYPLEVQVVDKKSAEENELGRSAHSEYKRAQVQTALKRVMGNLSDAVR